MLSSNTDDGGLDSGNSHCFAFSPKGDSLAGRNTF